MPCLLQRTGPQVLCPITALAFYRYRRQPSTASAGSEGAHAAPSWLVLAGEDGYLVVYGTGCGASNIAAGSFAGQRCYGRLQVFAEQAIQGCSTTTRSTADSSRSGDASAGDDGNDSNDGCDGDILVWGGSSVALVCRAHIARLLDAPADVSLAAPPVPADEVVAPDWIYDGLLPQRGRNGRAPSSAGALITAHNEVIPFWKRAGSLVLGTPISPSRPVLYSGQLAWSSSVDCDVFNEASSQLLVAAGTVFGEIVVWTCRLPADDVPAEPNIRVLRVFTGHEGSIFDVAVSPELTLCMITGDNAAVPGEQRRRLRLLASCSDDRTIRVWPLYLEGNSDGDSIGGSGTGDANIVISGEAVADATNKPRETGFQNTFDGLASRSDQTPNPAGLQKQEKTKDKRYLQMADALSSEALATVMAHASRIWHVRFGDLTTTAATGGEVILYSFGEDATTQEWQVSLGRSLDLSGKLVHLRTVASHAGKNIWSAAVSPGRTISEGASAAGVPLIATGGCDGKICVFEGRLRSAAAKDKPTPSQQSVAMASSTVPPKSDQPLLTTDTRDVVHKANDDVTPKSRKKGSQKKPREELFNSYAFLSDDQLLAATSHGRLLLGFFEQHTTGNEEAPTLSWTELLGTSDTAAISFQDYNVVRSPRGGGGGGVATMPGVEGLSMLGNASGQLFLFSLGGGLQQLATQLAGKVDEIFFLPCTTQCSSRGTLRLQVLATTLFRDEAALLDLEIDTAKGLVLHEQCCMLKLPTKAPASPAPMVITAASRCLEYIVLGSRTGQLCLYGQPNDGDDEATAVKFQLEAQQQTQTKDAILSIVPLPPCVGRAPLSCSSFVVTARDGTYRIYAIEPSNDTNNTATISLQHETATPFGPIVSDAWFVDGVTPGVPPELVLCGFRSTDFVVWNETRQQELAAVDCGGTHRTHTYLFCGRTNGRNKAEAGKIRFAFTRHSELHLFGQDACVISPLKTGGHGREIRTISASDSGVYLATGGEDTVIRLWGMLGFERRCLSVLKLHNTGLHSLVWLGDSYLISAAGSEELFVWRITTIQDSAYEGLAVMCESSYPDSTADKILRIIGLDASLDPDDSRAMLVSVGLSNSILKTYRYARPGRWQLLSMGHYTGACPMQLRHLPLRQGHDLLLLVAFADGRLTVWRATPAASPDHQQLRPYSDYVLACATRVHQNAVKALDLVTRPCESNQIANVSVFTGGDDNAIAVTSLDLSGNGIFAFGRSFRASKAHAAAVTGVRILGTDTDEAGRGRLTVVSCSNDQRVKAWHVLPMPLADHENKGLSAKIQLLDDRCSSIADPGDVECVSTSQGLLSAVVVGVGMETWSLGEY